MKKWSKGAVGALALVLALALPRPSAAYTWDFICGGDTNFSLCASVSISLSGNQVTMTVTNLTNSPMNPSAGLAGVENTAFTKIGLFNTTTALTGVSGLNPLVTGWDATLSPNPSGGQQLAFGVQTTKGINDAIPVQATVVFTFDLTGDLNQFETALARGEVGLSIHGQGGYQGNSTTCLTAGKNANCTPTTVPEPTTLLLMGTGIAGIAAIRRRRRVFLEEE